MGQESGGDAGAVSPKGASGLMQVMPPTGVDLGVTNLKDPYQSIFAGAKYLSQQLDKYKDPALALAAYNAGPGRTDDYLNKRVPLPAETLGYVPSVIARYAQAKAQAATGVPAVPQTATNPASAVPSDADFLKMIGAAPAASPTPATVPTVNNAGEVVSPPSTMVIKAPPSSGGLPSDADFLKMIGASAAPPPAPAPAAAPPPAQQLIPDPNTGGLTAIPAAPPAVQAQPRADLPAWAGGQGTVTAEPTPQQPGVLQHIGQAIASPFVDGGSLGPDTSTGTMFNGPMGLTNRLMIAQPLALADAIGRGALGAWRGLVAAGSEGLQGLGASPTSAANFERDLGGIAPNALAPLTMGADAAMRAGSVPPEAAPANALAAQTDIANRLQQNIANDVRGPARGAFLLDKIKTAINDADAPAPDANVPTSGVAPGMGGAAVNDHLAAPPVGTSPRSAGAAATPAELAAISPKKAAAYRHTAEMDAILAQAPRGLDTTTYVPGSVPTKAEYSGDPAVSQAEIALRERNPNAFQPRLDANMAARVKSYEDMAGTKPQIVMAENARDIQAQANLDSAFGNKKPVDATPVIDTIQSILKDPQSGESDAVRAFVAPVMKQLYNADGTLKTDPQRLYGVRQNIVQMLNKNSASHDSTVMNAKRELLSVRDSLDSVIEQGAPGYKKYLQDYTAASQPINAMELLQEFRPSLTNSKGEIMADRYDRFLKNLAEARASGGIDPSLSIPDETMQKLIDINRDMKRAGNINLGKAYGSPTNLRGEVAKGMGLAGAHIAAFTAGGPFGNMLLKGATDYGVPFFKGRKLSRLSQQHLAEPPSNRLLPPQD